MDWISIEERKPKEEKGRKGFSVNVLVTDGIRVKIGFYIFKYSIFECGEYINKDLDEVTHWMPLPEPPSKVE